jgi:hypothetical protein
MVKWARIRCRQISHGGCVPWDAEATAVSSAIATGLPTEILRQR